MRKLASSLYKAARLSNDVETALSGKPDRVARRIKNKVLGRALGRMGFWRLLWGTGSRSKNGQR